MSLILRFALSRKLECDDYINYLDCRRHFGWLDYPLGGEDLDVTKPLHQDKCKKSEDPNKEDEK